jgi:hypothetical protein
MKTKVFTTIFTAASILLLLSSNPIEAKPSPCKAILRKTTESLKAVTSNYEIRLKPSAKLQKIAKENALRITAGGQYPYIDSGTDYQALYFGKSRNDNSNGVTNDSYSDGLIYEALNSAASFRMLPKSTVEFGLAFYESDKKCYGSLTFSLPSRGKTSK